jgi:translation initiation factor 4E
MPAWEDPANKNGGKWSIQLPREKYRASIDQMWLYTVSKVAFCVRRANGQMLAAIGETFETAGDSTHEEPEGIVTGVIISPRPNLYVSCVS